MGRPVTDAARSGDHAPAVYDQDTIKPHVRSTMRRLLFVLSTVTVLTTAGAAFCAVTGEYWWVLLLVVATCSTVIEVDRCVQVLAAQAVGVWIPAEMHGTTRGFFRPRTDVEFVIGDGPVQRGRLRSLHRRDASDVNRVDGMVAVLPLTRGGWAVYSPHRHQVLLLRRRRTRGTA